MSEIKREILSEAEQTPTTILEGELVAIYETTANVEVDTFSETYTDQYIYGSTTAPVEKVLAGTAITVGSSSGDGSGVVTISSDSIPDVVTSVTGTGSGLGFSVTGSVYGVGNITLTTPSSFELSTTLGAQYTSVTLITGASGTVNHDYSVSQVFFHKNIASDFVLNLTGLTLAANEACNLVLILEQGSTAYLPIYFEINGNRYPVAWVNNELPTGNDWRHDTVTFNITNVAGMYSITGHLVSYGLDASEADPDYCQVSLLMHFNGSNGAAVFVDSSPQNRTISPIGSPITSTAQVKYGTASGYFNGGSWLSLPTSVSLSGSYTIEGWAHQSNPSYTTFQVNDQGSTSLTMLGYGGNGAILGASNPTNSNVFLQATGVPVNQWYHFAFVADTFTNSSRLYINGVLMSSSIGGSYAVKSFDVKTIGVYLSAYGNYTYTGYIDDLRITSGVARYSDNFIPPTYQFPDTAGHDCPLPPSPDFYGTSITLPVEYADNPGAFTTGSTTPLPVEYADNPGAFTTGSTTPLPVEYADNPGAFTAGASKILPSVYTPTTQYDPYIENVSLLLHMDGTNNSTAFVDSSTNTKVVTANGGTQIRTAQSKFGGASGYFDGSGDYLSIPHSPDFDFGSGNFTIESWIYAVSLPVYGPAIVSNFNFFNNPAGAGPFFINALTNGKISFYIYPVGTIESSSSISLNQWHHIAATRSGNNFYLFINGALVGTATSSAVIPANTLNINLLVGASPYQSGPNYWWNGYIDELRITKGVARYTTNFTPPTQAFPNS
jgi:hypothetical protein